MKLRIATGLSFLYVSSLFLLGSCNPDPYDYTKECGYLNRCCWVGFVCNAGLECDQVDKTGGKYGTCKMAKPKPDGQVVVTSDGAVVTGDGIAPTGDGPKTTPDGLKTPDAGKKTDSVQKTPDKGVVLPDQKKIDSSK